MRSLGVEEGAIAFKGNMEGAIAVTGDGQQACKPRNFQESLCLLLWEYDYGDRTLLTIIVPITLAMNDLHPRSMALSSVLCCMSFST